MFAPVRALSTAGSDEDASSLARLEEIRNLLHTLSSAGNPLLGTGWGIPYQKVTSVYANFPPEWWQYVYMPHNSLLGVAVFGGLVGVFGIWLVVPVAAFVATRGYRGATRTVDSAAAMAALCVLPAYGAQCYGDIGFQSLTCSLILGVAMAAAGKVVAWAEVPPQGARKDGVRVSERASPSARRWPYHRRGRPSPARGHHLDHRGRRRDPRAELAQGAPVLADALVRGMQDDAASCGQVWWVDFNSITVPVTCQLFRWTL
jgi:hypothetical protein